MKKTQNNAHGGTSSTKCANENLKTSESKAVHSFKGEPKKSRKDVPRASPTSTSDEDDDGSSERKGGKICFRQTADTANYSNDCVGKRESSVGGWMEKAVLPYVSRLPPSAPLPSGNACDRMGGKAIAIRASSTKRSALV